MSLRTIAGSSAPTSSPAYEPLARALTQSSSRGARSWECARRGARLHSVRVAGVTGSAPRRPRRGVEASRLPDSPRRQSAPSQPAPQESAGLPGRAILECIVSDLQSRMGGPCACGRSVVPRLAVARPSPAARVFLCRAQKASGSVEAGDKKRRAPKSTVPKPEGPPAWLGAGQPIGSPSRGPSPRSRRTLLCT